LVNIEHVAKKSEKYYKKIQARHQIIEKALNIKMKSLILALPMPTNESTIEKQQELLKENFLIGAIRQPTVSTPILRIIPRVGSSKKELTKLSENLKNR